METRMFNLNGMTIYGMRSMEWPMTTTFGDGPPDSSPQTVSNITFKSAKVFPECGMTNDSNFKRWNVAALKYLRNGIYSRKRSGFTSSVDDA